MKVFSLYHNETYVASFPNKEDAIFYGKQFYEDGWSCNIIEEYLSGISPNITKLVHTAQPNDPKPHFDTYGGVKAEPYKDVRAHWDKKGVMRPNWDNRVEGVDY
jgi:hypothetical protein